MTLVWKLLRRHVSLPQLAGFFLANLLGMLIVLLSIQFYMDVSPVFVQGDSFMKKDYIIVSKPVSVIGSLSGQANTFRAAEVQELARQPFCRSVGEFTACRYSVSAGLAAKGMGFIRTDMFFESVPQEYLDLDTRNWHFAPGDAVVPIILPRSYLSIYNFGFAQSRSLPRLSESLVGMMELELRLRGRQKEGVMQGRVVGFSNRLNTILVPQEFMDWSNAEYGSQQREEPSRLIVEVYNPTDERIGQYLADRGYETDADKLDAGKTTYFLKLVSGLVMGVGLLISALSFYILMLSVFLLVQKNATKLQDLLLIGYAPWRVALPYQLLTVGLGLAVLVLALLLLMGLRSAYLDMLLGVFPQLPAGTMWPAVVAGVLLCCVVSGVNVAVIYRKVMAIWNHKE